MLSTRRHWVSYPIIRPDERPCDINGFFAGFFRMKVGDKLDHEIDVGFLRLEWLLQFMNRIHVLFLT